MPRKKGGNYQVDVYAAVLFSCVILDCVFLIVEVYSFSLFFFLSIFTQSIDF